MQNTINKRTLAIIPCCNEEITIGSVVLKAKQYVDEVLVIDDGSTDDTAKIAFQAGAIVISHTQNLGKSAGIRTGFKYALINEFDYVITIDGDGQHNPDEIPVVLENVIQNGHDISIGYRVGKNTEMPFWRRIGKRVLDYTTSFGSGGHVTDSQCGFRAFNNKAVKGLVSRLEGDAFSVESEQLVKAHDLGLAVGNTPVTCKYKELETSTINPASHGISVLRYAIWLVAQKRPLLFIGVPGFIFVLIGISLGIYTLQFYNINHVFLVPYAILIAIFIIIGAIALFMGLILNVLPNIIKQSQKENFDETIFLRKK
jgi:glycosyltransferase involved in cell wall biosynthesis